MKVLLQSGANPNLPLGKGVCNAMCALASQAAHKSRALEAPSSSSLTLAHTLMLAGADIFCKVKLNRGGIGTVLDFAYAAFKAVNLFYLTTH